MEGRGVGVGGTGPSVEKISQVVKTLGGKLHHRVALLVSCHKPNSF